MAETLKVACPKCKQVLQVSAELRGKRVKCTGCGVVIAIPAAKPAPTAKPASTSKAATKSGATPVAGAQPPTVQAVGHEDEWGIIQSYEVERTDDKQRCPFCAHDLDDDQVVCLNCGYDLMKRDRIPSRVLHATTKMNYFIWWLPAIICALIMFGCIAMIVMILLGRPSFGAMDWMQRKGVAGEARWGYFYSSVFFAFIGFFNGRFAFKRLILNPHPPDQEKHLHKEDEEEE